jgi:hypothetical protein
VKLFFSTLPRNIIGCFKGRMILWHLVAWLLGAFPARFRIASRPQKV